MYGALLYGSVSQLVSEVYVSSHKVTFSNQQTTITLNYSLWRVLWFVHTAPYCICELLLSLPVDTFCYLQYNVKTASVSDRIITSKSSGKQYIYIYIYIL